MDGDESGAQEVRAEDLDAHMQAIIEWAEQVNAKRPNQTLKRLSLQRSSKALGTHMYCSCGKQSVDFQFT